MTKKKIAPIPVTEPKFTQTEEMVRLVMALWSGSGLAIGDKVKKKRGYEFDSVVVSVFENLNGDTRVVCESTLIPGLLHIFNLDQVEKV